MNQARADAFVDLILGNAQVKTHVTVAVPVAMTETIGGGEPADPRDGAVEVLGAEVPGVGIVPSADLASLVGGLGATIGRMLIDHETGTTRETSIDRYRPSPAMVRHLQLRDGTCRFPNCGIRAERCDIDHVTPWPAGSTSIENLMVLCRHHHRLKTHTRWRVRLSDTAEATWTDPYGTEWVTRPRNHHHWSAA